MPNTPSILLLSLMSLSLLFLTSCQYENVVPLEEREPIQANTPVYTMPAEETLHEGTWLQWPHDYGWDRNHVSRYESSWVEMIRALHTGEKVHLVLYNQAEKDRVESLLTAEGLDMNQIDFFIWPTDDVWVRDNGPVFVFDATGNLALTDWRFNGWGNKSEYTNCDAIPAKVSEALNIPRVQVNMVNEGGSVEVDGNGTLMAKRSSILNENRNPGWTQANAEAYFSQYLGVTHFIWLEGVKGQDITDDHIDGTARFANGNTLLTFYPQDADPDEYQILSTAVNAQGDPYQIVHLPLTQNNVPGTGEKGIYTNFYVGNTVVLVPIYNDPSDAEALATLQGLYPNRTVVGIESAELSADGGMVHCVTQQQPAR